MFVENMSGMNSNAEIHVCQLTAKALEMQYEREYAHFILLAEK